MGLSRFSRQLLPTRQAMSSGLRRVWWQSVRRTQYPFLLFRRSVAGLVWAFNWWDVIDEQVLLGGALMFDDIERLRYEGVRAVVNLCIERPDETHVLGAAQMEYLWLPVMDARPPSMAQILEGLAWIEQRVHAGQTVYIHCAAGIGRSTTLLACWYIYTQGMCVPEVLDFIKRRRPQVSLTRRQVQRLEEFASFSTATRWRARSGTLPTSQRR